MTKPITLLAQAIQEKQPAVMATIIEVNGASRAKTDEQIVLAGGQSH